jgi:hypothetical protein
MVKGITNVSYNVLQMCTEVYNSTPGSVLKNRIIKIVVKLLLEYGENSKKPTDQMKTMMREISRFNIDMKLAPDFLTAMLNVINVIHQKRDEETDDFMGVVDEEDDNKKCSLVNNHRKTLGPRKQNVKTEEIIPKKKSVLIYNSSDSEDTMRSKIPMKLDIVHNNIVKLKQRILVWADQQSGYDAKDVSAKHLLKILDQIYSVSYRALKSVSVEEARQVDLPPWLTTRLKDNTTNIIIQQENTKNIKAINIQTI